MAQLASNRGKNRRGIALMVTLLLIMLLSVVVWSFQRDVMREIHMSGNVRDDLKAAYQAQMGLVRAQAILRTDEKADYDSLNEPWAKPTNWKGETFGNDSAEETTAGVQPQVIITDEERKFNLLTVIRGSEKQREAAAQTLERLINICRRQDERLELEGATKNVRKRDDGRELSTEVLVKNLIKYLEEKAREDSDELDITARDDANPDYRSINKQSPFPMLTIGELMQIEGWTKALLFGKPHENTSGTSGSNEESTDYYSLGETEQFEKRKQTIENIDAQSRDPENIGLMPFITLYSMGQINVNTAPRELLLALNKDLTWDVVDKILTAREAARQEIVAAEENGGTPPAAEQPATNPDGSTAEEEDKASFRTQDLASFKAFGERITGEKDGAVEGLTEEIFNAIKPLLTVKSRAFMVEAQGHSGKVTKTMRAIYKRTGSNAAAAPAATTPAATTPAATTPATPAAAAPAASEDGLPPDSKVTLTLLLIDEVDG